jgi:hypothetical protein
VTFGILSVYQTHIPAPSDTAESNFIEHLPARARCILIFIREPVTEMCPLYGAAWRGAARRDGLALFNRGAF